VILAVNNNPMRFTDRSGGVSRRRVIIHFPEQIAPEERDPQLRDKIARELAVIVRQLMQQFSDPMSARALLQSQQNSDEALSIKRDADPTFDFCGYLEMLPQTNGMFMGMPVSSRVITVNISITRIWPIWRPTATGTCSA
jgi:putative DNA primase/helicase